MRRELALLRDADRPLLWGALCIAALAPLSATLSLGDPRLLDGSNVWLKPLKFQVSMAVYLATIAVMVPLAPTAFRRSVLGRTAVWTAVGAAAFEVVYITGRSAFAQRSHYATDTAIGTVMYTLMAIAAVLLSLAPVVIATGAWRAERTDQPIGIVRRGALLGAAVSFVGAAVIGFLLGASPEHYPRDAAEAATRMPVTGWLLERGDLRIAHFVGLHALQGMLALGVVLSRAPTVLAGRVLTASAAAWLLATLLLAALALDDRSPFPRALVEYWTVQP